MSQLALRQGTVAPPAAGSTVSDLIRVVRRQAVWAFGVALLTSILVVVVTLSLPPRFTASGTIYVTPDTPDPLAPADTSPRPVEEDMVATVAELLRGRDLVTQVVQSIRYDDQPGQPGLLHRAGCTILPFLSRCAPPKTPTLDERVDAFLTRLSVTAGEHSRVIQLQMTGGDPAVAAAAINALVASYQDSQIAVRTQDLQRTAGWIAHRADTLREHWLQTEAKLGAYRAAHGLGNVGGNSPALIDQQIEHAAQDLSYAQSALATAQSRANALRSGGFGAELAESPGLVAMNARVAEAEAADSALRSQYGPRHPQVLAADRQVAAARSGLAAEDGRVRGSVNADVTAKAAAVATLTANLQALRNQASTLSGTTVDLGTLTNEAQEARTAYEGFQSRSKQLGDRTQLLQPEVRFASHATPPGAPSFPNVPRFLAGGLALGLLAGLGAAVTREHFRQGFANVSRVSEELSVPLLSIVPRVADGKGDLAHYLEQLPFSDAAESIRALAARLQTGMAESPRSVVIASATGSEGKTTVALWLAAALAGGGQKILLVDGDHRRGRIAQALGDAAPRRKRDEAPIPGFADLVLGDADADDVIRHDPAGRFDYVGAGTPTARAFGGPELRRLTAALRRYRDLYDVVVIDTPPLLAMTEALLCAHAADSTVFVCRWNSTRREAVMNCLMRLNEAGASVAGVVLSMMDKKRLALFSDEHQAADIKLIEGYYRGA